MPQFQRDKYVKICDVEGNYHFGYISQVKDRGFTFVIDITEEGLSKINYDAEHTRCVGGYTTDFEETLTDIEKALIPLLACGMSTKEIGVKMEISPVTVRAHFAIMKLKLRVETREQLMAYAQGIALKIKG
jgi:DNA-binding NarL/FixJ family response regulator